MFTEYSLQLASWWALFGASALIAIALNSDDDDPAPETDDPFTGQPGYEEDAQGAQIIGDDTAEMITADPDVATAIAGKGGDDSITGSAGRDYILAGDGNDEIEGRVGADVIFGGNGDDWVDAGVGNDVVGGDAGNDVIFGNGGDDYLGGLAGDDSITGGSGADEILGGDGNDTLSGFISDRASATTDPASAANPDLADTLHGGAGDDELWLGQGDLGTGGEGADTFRVDHRGDFDDGARLISDFDRDADAIILHVDAPADPVTGAPDYPTITQAVSADGADRIIMADGVQIVVLRGIGAEGPVPVTFA